MAIVTLDFESFWSKDYSLKKMSEVDYILSPLFETIMVAIKVGDGPTTVHKFPSDIRRALDAIDWPNSAMLSHNTRFDGAILAWHYGHIPGLYLDSMSMARAITHASLGSSALAKLATYFRLPAKGDAVVNAMGKTRADFSASELDEYADYCAHDTDLCRAIYDRLKRNFPNSELKVIDLALRQYICPQVKLDEIKLAEHLNLVRAEKAASFARVAHIPASVFSSNQQFAELLQSYNVEVPTKVSPTTGSETWALAKNDRDFKDLCNDPDQPADVQALLACRLNAKSTIEETRCVTLLNLAQRDWSRRIGVSGTRWMPVPYRYYGAHCVPGDTEVLTRDGWLSLRTWDGGDIAQVHTDQTIEFLPATRFVGPETDQWVSVRAPYLRCDFTPGHTVPRLMQHHFAWDTIQAAELLERSFIWTPLAGRLLTTGLITPEQMRVLAMVQADGHWETDVGYGRGLFVFLKKPRKIERARVLLTAASVPYRESEFDSHAEYVRFSIRQADAPAWLTSDRKFFGAWLLDSMVEAREALMQEVQHWDGWVQGNQVCYSSSDRVNADWLATVAHLSGRCASINVHPGSGNRRDNYRVQLRQRSYGIVEKDHSEASVKPQRAYCATTQTGFFLARSHGRIFVTGNTGRFSGDGGYNFANLKRGSPIRGAITAPEGYRIVHRDSSQIEARIVAWLAKCEHLVTAFAEGRDVYSEFASKFYKTAVTKADTLRRFTGKTAILSLGYGAGAAKFRHALYIGSGGVSLDLTLDQARELVSFYRDTYWQIPELWRKGNYMLDRMIQPQKFVVEPDIRVIQLGEDCVYLPNGLTIQYPKLRSEIDPDDVDRKRKVYDGSYGGVKKIYGAKAIENITQALARIVVTDIALRVHRETGFHPFMSTYDSHDYCVPEREVYDFDRVLESEFMVVPEWALGLPLASEGGWGRNLLEAEKGVNQ